MCCYYLYVLKAEQRDLYLSAIVSAGHEISFNFTAGFDGRESNQRGISELSVFIISTSEHRSIWERKQTCGLPTQHFIRDTYQISKQRSVNFSLILSFLHVINLSCVICKPCSSMYVSDCKFKSCVLVTPRIVWNIHCAQAAWFIPRANQSSYLTNYTL